MFAAIRRRVASIGVLGLGEMGSGITIVSAAVAGVPTKVLVRSDARVEKFKREFNLWLRRSRIKNPDEVRSRISYVKKVSELADVDFAIESISEREDDKKKLCSELTPLMKPDAVFATNTSTMPITKIAGWCARPENVIGMHFMNPVPVMKLVELIKALQTSESTTAKTVELAKKMGKDPVFSTDRPGFIASRLFAVYANEGFTMFCEGVATREDIDKGMVLGAGMPMGPVTVCDYIGLDVYHDAISILYKEFGDSKFIPPAMLMNYVNAGWIGRKAGRGAYQYRR